MDDWLRRSRSRGQAERIRGDDRSPRACRVLAFHIDVAASHTRGIIPAPRILGATRHTQSSVSDACEMPDGHLFGCGACVHNYVGVLLQQPQRSSNCELHRIQDRTDGHDDQSQVGGLSQTDVVHLIETSSSGEVVLARKRVHLPAYARCSLSHDCHHSSVRLSATGSAWSPAERRAPSTAGANHNFHLLHRLVVRWLGVAVWWLLVVSDL